MFWCKHTTVATIVVTYNIKLKKHLFDKRFFLKENKKKIIY